MKKALLLLTILFLLLFGVSCSKGTTEMTIEEFGEKWEKVENKLEEDTKYWTDAEKQSSKYYKLLLDIAEENGFSKNMKLKIRGVMSYATTGAFSVAAMKEEDEKSTNSYNLLCLNENKAVATIKEGDNIIVSGILLKEKKLENGTIVYIKYLSDTVIESHDLTNITYTNNIKKIREDCKESIIRNEVITGKIEDITSLTLTDEQKEDVLDAATGSLVENEFSIAFAMRYSDKVCKIISDDNSTYVLGLFDSRNCDLQVGQKITIKGDAFYYDGDCYVDLEDYGNFYEYE